MHRDIEFVSECSHLIGEADELGSKFRVSASFTTGCGGGRIAEEGEDEFFEVGIGSGSSGGRSGRGGRRGGGGDELASECAHLLCKTEDLC